MSERLTSKATGSVRRERPIIAPDWTLEQLKGTFPGVELVLFSQFGIGSRERSGFSGSENLTDLLRRHLVFDAERACDRLNVLAKEDWEYSIGSVELARILQNSEAAVVDARSETEFRLSHLPTARLLSEPVVAGLRANSPALVVTVCKDGTQAPAASRVLRSLGLSAVHLTGGLSDWSRQVDPQFPILYPLEEQPGLWYLLADGDTLRFRRSKPKAGWGYCTLEQDAFSRSEAGRKLKSDFPSLEMIISTPETFAVRGLPDELEKLIKALTPALIDNEDWQRFGFFGDETIEREVLEETLATEAPKILKSHKGTVLVDSYTRRVLTLTLGGGCAGCASAQVTTQRELAASLYRAVPVLDQIRNKE